MTAESVLELLALLESSNIAAWVDGGWGVDALLGCQSRPHEDVDLVVALDDVDRIRETLALQGFALSEDHLPVRFVMVHPLRGRIDFHTVTFDDAGGVQVQPNGGAFRYPSEGFTFGAVLGRRVPCVSAEVQLLCHMGYEPTAKDVGDVLLLHKHFGVPLPPSYSRTVQARTNGAAAPDGGVETARLNRTDPLPRRG